LIGVFLTAVLALALWAPVISNRLEEKNNIADKNVQSREAFWSAATRMWMDSPVFGVGPERFGVESAEYVRSDPTALRDPVVHNAYLEILAENGLVALVLFLAMMAAAWTLLTKGEREARRRGEPEDERFAAAVKGALIVAAVSAIFLSEQVAAPIWLICALAASGAVLRSPVRSSLPKLARAGA
jgi:O-antigen ligase